MKTIAGFSNSEGGKLLIGVKDNGEVLGLNNDYQSLQKKKDNDGLQLHLMNLIDKHFGKVFCQQNVTVDFPIIDEQEICLIDIIRGKEPLFIDYLNNHGQRTEKFFIRKGNATEAIEKPSEIADYIKNRF